MGVLDRLMELGDLVARTPVSCPPEASLADAARLMQGDDVGSVLVMSSGALTGILTERDILRAAAEDADLKSEPVTVWMTPDPDTIDSEMDIAEAAAWLVASGYRHIPVVEGDRLIGVTSIKDVLWALTEDAIPD